VDLHNDPDALVRIQKLIRTLLNEANPRRPPITQGRAYRAAQRHYAVQRRLLGPRWPSSFVAALHEEREHGATVREAVARVYRRLRRIQRSRGCQ
jgi:hypothetical protein